MNPSANKPSGRVRVRMVTSLLLYGYYALLQERSIVY